MVWDRLWAEASKSRKSYPNLLKIDPTLYNYADFRATLCCSLETAGCDAMFVSR